MLNLNLYMKRIFVILFSVLIFILVTPTQTKAQSCSSRGGYCTILRCTNGELTAGSSSCFLLSHCCYSSVSANPDSCMSKGGHCIFSGTCAIGTISGATDCNVPGYICCQNSPTVVTRCLGGNGIETGIGCLNTSDPEVFVSQLISWAVGIAGGISFILLLVAGFQITTSAGDPKKLKAGQELLWSALSGLILIALSVVLLNFIGIRILNLGALGFVV
jgi:hypothetical protein